MINKDNFKVIKKEEGLSMIELLATISILVSVVMVILVLGDRAVSQSALFATQTQALFLAKEGMEIVGDNNKHLIKEETLEGNKHWSADYSSGVNFINEQDCKDKLKINNQGFYNHDAGDNSPFSRCIVSEMDGNKLKVTVNVYFSHKGKEQVITLYRIFYFDE